MVINIPKGVFDILPEDPKEQWQLSHYWSYVESIVRDIASVYGFKEIRTPIFEKIELFKRSVGETSDIVSKEMYTFYDKANRLMALRPEGTAPVMRAYIEKKLYNKSDIHKFFYMGPMFRYERPQAGRYRQHHQFGIEAIGSESPYQDVEIIDMVYTLYNELGIKNLTFHINSIGDVTSRIKFRKTFQDYLKPYLDSMSEESKKRFEINPLRIFDSKDSGDQEIIKNSPSILDYIDDKSKKHFDMVCKLLDNLNIPYKISPKLVRGLDYYNKTVFEIMSHQLGAQNSIGGGGRYDGLIKSLGAPDIPAVGFSTGLERVIQTMSGQQVVFPQKSCPDMFFIPIGDRAREVCFDLLRHMRELKVYVEMDFSDKKVRHQMRYANFVGAKHVVVIGEDELSSNELEIKNMSTGTTEKCSLDDFRNWRMK